MRHYTSQLISIFLAATLGSCGLKVPEMQETYQKPHDYQALVGAIISEAYCEIKKSVQFVTVADLEASQIARKLGYNQPPRLDFLSDWGAQVTLDLTVEDKTALNPGVSFNTPMHSGVTHFVGENVPGMFSGSAATLASALTYSFITTPQNYALSLGGTASTNATRRGTVAFFLRLGDFLDKRSLTEAKAEKDRLEKEAVASGADDYAVCKDDGFFIEGDLKFKQQLYAILQPLVDPEIPNFAEAMRVQAAVSKRDVIQHDVNFIITTGGNITPGWKLVRISANQSGNLFSTSRARTQHVLITLGPLSGTTALEKAKAKTLASQAAQQHSVAENASLITSGFKTIQ
jgi:hypothetical protein